MVKIEDYRDNYGNTIDDYNKLIDKNSRDNLSKFLRGCAYCNVGLFKAGKKDFDELLASGGSLPGVFKERAFANFKLKNYKEALEDCSKAMLAGQVNAVVYTLCGDIFFGMQDYKKAVEDYTAAIKIDPTATAAYFKRAHVYSDTNEIDLALQDINTLILMYPKNNDYYRARANLFAKKRRYGKAIEDYSKAIALDPEKLENIVGRARVYYWYSEYALSIRDWDTAINKNPKVPKYYCNRAHMYIHEGQAWKAIKDCETALEMKPDYPPVYKVFGDALYEMTEYAKSIEKYSKAIELGDNSYDTYLRRGDAYLVVGNNDEAMKDFEQASKLITADELNTCSLILNLYDGLGKFKNGVINSNAGKSKEAVEQFLKALKNDTNYSLWLYVIHESETAKKDFVEARRQHQNLDTDEFKEKMRKIAVETADMVKSTTGKKLMVKITSPVQIKEMLDKTVVGHEKAKISLSVAIYNHLEMIKSPVEGRAKDGKCNILLIGPTGSGKTLLCETIAQILDVPFAKFDMTSMAQTGIVGGHITDVFKLLYIDAGKDQAKAERGIIFFDEIDKLAAENRKEVQVELLKTLEANTIRQDTYTASNSKEQIPPLNTGNILFIAGGAFVGLDRIRKTKLSSGIGFSNPGVKETPTLSDSLIIYGIMPELIGRLHTKIVLDALTKEELIQIINNPENGLLDEYRGIFKKQGINLVFTDSVIDAIAQRTLDNHCGARGLRGMIYEILTIPMYRSFGNPSASQEVKITEEYLNVLEDRLE